jgi:hypothetical protein
MRRVVLASLLSLAAGALAAQGLPDALIGDGPASSNDRRLQRTFLERPFSLGPVAVVAAQGRELRQVTLVPCQGGHGTVGAVCEAGRPDGAAGALRLSPDWTSVHFRDRVYWLSPGNDGYLQLGSTLMPLSWAAMIEGTGPGTDPALEQPVPHR